MENPFIAKRLDIVTEEGLDKRLSLAVGEKMVSSAGTNDNGAAGRELELGSACDAVGCKCSLGMLVPKGDSLVDHGRNLRLSLYVIIVPLFCPGFKRLSQKKIAMCKIYQNYLDFFGAAL